MRGSFRNRFGERRPFEPDQVDVDAVRRQRARVVLHAGAFAEIGQREDDGTHDGWGSRGERLDYTTKLRRVFFKRLCDHATTARSPRSERRGRPIWRARAWMVRIVAPSM